MKILIVNTFDIKGGASRAAYRLHRALLAQNANSKMLVQSKSSDDYTVISESNRLKKAFNNLRPFIDSIPVLCRRKSIKTTFSPSVVPFSQIIYKINELNPDIVHLHWICAGMMRVEDLVKIKAPVVWSLHDNWGFTGGCHVKWECDKYKDRCGACPRLESLKENDLSRRVWNRVST